MAVLVDGRLLISDAADTPLNGGKARIYNANTTTLTSVFSDAALSVPLTNPVVASASGITPMIFAAEGTTVDIQYLTSADVPVSGRSYEDMVFLGSDTGTFTRTLADNTRFSVYGSGGVVYVTVGDASPDNTGGTLELSGWLGTQGDTATIGFALVNVTGRLKEQGKKIPAVVYTEATTFAAATSVDIALPNDPTGCRAWEVELFDLVCSAAGNLRAVLSYDGSTFKTGASDYHYQCLTSVNGSVTSTAAAATAFVDLAVGFGPPAGTPGTAKIEVLTPNSGTDAPVIRARVDGFSTTAGGTPSLHICGGHGLGGYGRVQIIRVSKSSGTIAGKYRVAPLRGYGET